MIKINAKDAERVTLNVIETKYKIEPEVYEKITSLIESESKQGRYQIKIKLNDYFNAPEQYKEHNEIRIDLLCYDLNYAGYYITSLSGGILTFGWNPFRIPTDLKK